MGVFEGELASKIDFSCFAIEKGGTSRNSIFYSFLPQFEEILLAS
jgi:hypothetical protein